MLKLDCIFIDLDGTLLEGKLKHYNCYKDIILKDGGTPLDINIYWDMKRSKITRDVFLEKSKYKSTYNDFLMQWLENIESEKYLYYDKLKPDVINVLNKWTNYTNRIILTTMRNNHENLYRQLDNLKIRDVFDEIIICRCQENNEKYKFVKNIKFTTAVVIGDTEHDITLAEKLNIQCIAVTNGMRKKEFLNTDYFEEEIKDIDIENIINIIY
jgi:phosphoglycolate phosphatase-like HAD superfamily hydrolase